MASKSGGLNTRNDYSPESEPQGEVATWDNVECRPCPNGGKAEVLREETGKRTAGTAGVEI